MVSVMFYPSIFCVALLMDLFILCVACLTVFVNCLVKQFAICLGVVVPLHLSISSSYILHSNNTCSFLCFYLSTPTHIIIPLPITNRHPSLTINLN